MSTFLKWFTGSLLLLTFLIGIKLWESGPGELHYVAGGAAIVAGALLLAALFYYLEVHFIPRRCTRLLNRLVDQYSAIPLSDRVVRMRIGNTDVYAEIHFSLYLTEHGSYHESIQFHIPREQANGRFPNETYQWPESVCNGVFTYKVYETTPKRLRKAEKKLMETLAPY